MSIDRKPDADNMPKVAISGNDVPVDHSMSSDTGHTECEWCGEDPDSLELTDEDLEPVYCTLHFYYNDPDSMRRLDECMRASDVKLVLFYFDQWLRKEIKYMEREDEDALQEVRDRLWEICEQYNVDPWED